MRLLGVFGNQFSSLGHQGSSINAILVDFVDPAFHYRLQLDAERFRFLLILAQVLRDARYKYSKQTAIRPFGKEKLLGEDQACEKRKTEGSKK
jgi:hypothetical protein